MFVFRAFVMQEIPRTPDHAPSRTFYLFSVNRQHVAKTCLQLSYQVLGEYVLCQVLVNAHMYVQTDRMLQHILIYEKEKKWLKQTAAAAMCYIRLTHPSERSSQSIPSAAFSKRRGDSNP